MTRDEKEELMQYQHGVVELDKMGKLTASDAIRFALEYLHQEILYMADFNNVSQEASEAVLNECIAKLKEKEMK